MGCGGTKETYKETRKIKHNFEKTNIPKYDEFFDKAHETLKICEELRHGLQDCPDEMIESTDVDALIPTPGNLLEALKVFLWSVSATNDGQVSKAKFEFSGEAPFATFDNNYLYVEQVDFKNPFNEWLKTLIEGPIKIVKLVEDIVELIPKATAFTTSAADDCKAAGLDPFATAKAVAATGKNVKLL